MTKQAMALLVITAMYCSVSNALGQTLAGKRLGTMRIATCMGGGEAELATPHSVRGGPCRCPCCLV